MGEPCYAVGRVIKARRGRTPRRVPVKRLGILLSGRGSNFEAIADQVAAGRIDAEIAVVISNRPEARGLDAACRRGLKAVCDSFEGSGSRGLRPHC